MAEGFKPIAEYMKEASGLTSSLFQSQHKYPVLLWPQAGDWIEDTAFQFETFSSEYSAPMARLPPIPDRGARRWWPMEKS